jgi:DNA polymerase
MPGSKHPIEQLRWQVEAGADEAVDEAPVNRYATAHEPKGAAKEPPAAAEPSPPAGPAPRARPAPGPAPELPGIPPAPTGRGAAQQSAHALAAAAKTLDELKAALDDFDQCPLKKTATNLVFGDGNPEAPVVFIGEAPGADEDLKGLPFVGRAGRLLDRMLAAIGRDRSGAYITNILYWRPPGNRQPTAAEISACLPFIERHIELLSPEVLVFLGGTAAKTLLGRSEGIMKLRGRWFDYATPGLARPVPAMATFHPAYLLRSPGQKRAAWQDLLEIKAKLETLAHHRAGH